MRTEEKLRADIVEIGRRLWERGYVASNDGNISVRLDQRRLITTPAGVSKGFMTAEMMVVTDFDGQQGRRRSKGVVGTEDAPAGVSRPARCQRRGARASTHRDWIRRGRHSTRSRRAGGSRRPRSAASRSLSTRRRRPTRLPAACSKYLKAHDGLLARQSRCARDRPGSVYRVLPDGDDRAFREDQPGDAHAGARESALAPGSAAVAGAARHVWHRVAGACLHRRHADGGTGGQVECQVVQAPDSPLRARGSLSTFRRLRGLSGGGEIRLTYREFTALIEDAVRSLR